VGVDAKYRKVVARHKESRLKPKVQPALFCEIAISGYGQYQTGPTTMQPSACQL
jgi:hypothetical protein